MAQNPYIGLNTQEAMNRQLTNGLVQSQFGPDPLEAPIGANQAKNKNSITIRNSGITTKNTPITQEEYNKYLAMGRSSPESQGIQRDIDTQEQALNMMRGLPTQKEAGWVKPLLALADSQTGSKLLQGYEEPTGNANQIAVISKFKDSLAKKNEEYMKLLTGKIPETTGTTQEAGVTTNMDTQEADKKAFNPNSGANNNLRANAYYTKMYQQDPFMKGSYDRQALLTKFYDAVKSNNNPTEINNLGETIAKSMQGSRPSIALALKEGGGNPAVLERFDQIIQKLSEGNLTPENQKLYMKFAQDMADVEDQAISATKAKLARIGKINFKLSPDEVGAPEPQYAPGMQNILNEKKQMMDKAALSGGFSPDKLKRLQELKAKAAGGK